MIGSQPADESQARMPLCCVLSGVDVQPPAIRKGKAHSYGMSTSRVDETPELKQSRSVDVFFAACMFGFLRDPLH